MSNEKALPKQRDGFQTKVGFILACIGSAVGMGNIWRFPIMVSRYGGLTFLLPYFVFVVLIASSGVMEEFALGRKAGAGPIGAFGMCTEERTGNRAVGEWIGVIPIIGALGLSIGYTVVLGWIFRYTGMAFTGELYDMGQDMGVIGGTFDIISVDNLPWIIIAILVAVIVMSLGVSGGIERANKILMPLLFALFVGLGIYIFTLPGSSEGYRYIFTLNPAGLLDPEVYIYAFGQAFFSLSVAGNGSVIYGSYLSKKESIPSCARNVAVFDTIAAMLAALVILPAMAAGGVSPDTSGPGLMFIYLVNVFNGMPGGRVIGIFFFVAVLFAGVSSIINLYEAPVALLQEKFHLGRVQAVLIILIFGCLVAIGIQPITSEWMDAVSIYICPLGALLAAIMFFWVLKKRSAMDAVNEGADKPIGNWFYPLGKYVYVFSAFVALVAGAFFGGIG